MAGMTISELQKKTDRIPTLINMIVGGSIFTLIKGNKKFKASELRIQTSKNSIKNYDIRQLKSNQKKLITQIEKMGGGVSQKLWLYGLVNGDKNPVLISTGEVAKSSEFGGKAGAPSTTPSTAEQEKVTLKIMEILLKKNGYNPLNKKEEKLQSDFDKFAKKDLSKLWPGILGDSKAAREWYKHFFLQFKEIEQTTKLPNDIFDFYHYDEFMSFISDLVTAGPPAPLPNTGRTKKWPKFGVISQKDSWNPADVWLVNKKGTAYKKLLKEIEQCKYISQVNAVLKRAFKGKDNGGKPVVAGISLKKSSGKALHYELVNLAYKGSSLPQVEYGGMVLDLPWSNGVPDKVTSMLYVTEMTQGNKSNKEAMMRIGSSGTANLNLEFGAKGGAAQLGKVPKTLATKRIQNLPGLGGVELPSGNAAEASIPENNSDAKAKIWQNKIREIKNYSGTGRKGIFKIPSAYTVDNFIDNIIAAKNSEKWKGEVQQKVLIVIQIMEFAYLLTQIYKGVRSRDGFDDFVEDLYYYSQKKGSNFGPFGKLY